MRHGESQANTDGVFAGPSYQAPLTKLGQSQAQLEGARVKSEGITFDRIVASPITRAKQTAELLAEAGGKVTSLSGDEQRYDQPINGAIASNGRVHDELVSMVKEKLR